MTVKPIQFKEFAPRDWRDFFGYDKGNTLLDLRSQPAPRLLAMWPFQPPMPHKPKALDVHLSGQMSAAEKMRVITEESLRSIKQRLVADDIAHRLLTRRLFEDSQANKHARVKVIEYSEKLQQFMFETIAEKKQAQLALIKQGDLDAQKVSRELHRMGVERLDAQIATNQFLTRDAKKKHLATVEQHAKERLNYALEQLARTRPRNSTDSVHHNNEMLRIFSEEMLAKAAFLRAWNHLLAAHGVASMMAMQQAGMYGQPADFKGPNASRGPLAVQSVIMTKI